MECKPVTGQSTSGNGEPEPLQIAVTWSPSTTVRLLWLTLISGRSEKGIQRRRKRKICYPMFLLLKVCIHQSCFHPFHKTHHHLNNLSVTPYLPNTSSSPLFPSAIGLLKSALITALSTLGMLYHWDSNWNWSDTTPKRFFFFLNVWKWLKFPTVLGFKFTKLSLWMSRYLPHHISTLSQHRHRPCSHPLPAEMTTRSLGCLALFTFRSRWLLQEHFTKSFTCAWSTSYCTAHH